MPRTPSGGAAGAVAALIGAAFFHIASVVSGGSAFDGVIVDGVVAFVVIVAGAFFARSAFVAGVVAGVVCAADVFFVVRYGAPFTWAQAAWASGASLAIGGADLAVSVAAIVVVVMAAFVGVRAPPPRVLAAALLVTLLGLCTLPLGSPRAHPLIALLPSSSTSSPSSSPLAIDFRKPLDEPDAEIDADADADADVDAEIDVDRARKPKHVVLFISESTAARFVDATTMPKLAALQQQQSLTFTQHVAESPISIKAIFATLCGLHPDPTTALETTDLPRIDCQSLPERLHDAGFDAALVHGGYFAFTDKLAFLNERGFDHLVDGEALADATLEGKPCWQNGWGIDDRCAVDDALAWLDHRADPTRPSFLVVISLIPHHEYFLPDGVAQPFGTKAMIDRYKNGLRFADDVFARVVDGYRARGLAGDAAFVFVGDHGEAFDEHPQNRLHGSFLFEENLRAPLVIVSQAFAANSTSSRPSTHADLAPTFLDLLGMPPSPTMQGQSLLSSSPRFVPHPQPLFTAIPVTRVGMRTPRWKFIRDVQSGTDSLFDLSTDPAERKNVVDEQPQIARALRGRALDFLQQQPKTLRALPTLSPSTYMQTAARVAGVDVIRGRVMNMERPCIPVDARPGAPLTLTFPALQPPARSVGVGVRDASRFRHDGGLHVRVGAAAFDVDDGFLTSSRVVTLPAPAADLVITIEATKKAAQGCVWLQP